VDEYNERFLVAVEQWLMALIHMTLPTIMANKGQLAEQLTEARQVLLAEMSNQELDGPT
jgi:hypothetical protein